ncbi:MAG: Hsp70 family protein, partial [Synechococcales bacterium]|nr:Hsp70 family protein [Synechococcales bacterium]
MVQPSTYAIDFGTSNTVIARWNGATQTAETLPLSDLCLRLGDNPPLIPSQLYVKDAAAADVLVGQQVSDRGLNLAGDRRFFRNFKRGIGVPIQGFLPDLDGVTLTFEQVGQWFLSQLIQTLQESDPALNALIFTVPVDSFEAYRHWLGQACQAFPVEQVRMLDEPTAAALGYGLADQERLLVVDFGGGTLDLSLVQLEVNRQTTAKPLGFILRWGNKSMAEDSTQQRQTARVLAKAGQNLGGADIDNWLVDYFAATQGIAASPLTLRLAERLKVQLSSQPMAGEVHFNDETLETLELQLDRDR